MSASIAMGSPGRAVRKRLSLCGVSVLTVVMLAGCLYGQPDVEESLFEPGTWVDQDTGARLELSAGGAGLAEDIVVSEGSVFECTPGSTEERYSGPVRWGRHENTDIGVNELRVIYERGDGTHHDVLFVPQSYSPENWDVLLSLPCGDPDTHADFRYTRVDASKQMRDDQEHAATPSP